MHPVCSGVWPQGGASSQLTATQIVEVINQWHGTEDMVRLFQELTRKEKSELCNNEALSPLL